MRLQTRWTHKALAWNCDAISAGLDLDLDPPRFCHARPMSTINGDARRHIRWHVCSCILFVATLQSTAQNNPYKKKNF